MTTCSARLRQASRLFADRDRVLSHEDLTTIEACDIRASRLFGAPSGTDQAAQAA